VIQEKLSLDLSELAAQAQQFQLELRQADARAEMAHRRIQSTIDSVNELDRRSSQVLARLESKIKAQAKLALRGGIAAGLDSVLDSINLGEDPFSVAGSRIISSTVTAGAFGGLPAAVVTGITSSILELKRANDETKRQLREAQVKFRAELDNLREETYSLGRTADERLEALAQELKEDLEKQKIDTEELDYQTSQYVE
jgi:hypothetical protein